jgi:hypothetical protein
VYTKTAVDSCAGEADEDAELGRSPLWRWGVAVGTAVVVVGLLDLEKLGVISNELRAFIYTYSH